MHDYLNSNGYDLNIMKNMLGIDLKLPINNINR